MFSEQYFPSPDIHAFPRNVVGASYPIAYSNLQKLTLKSSTAVQPFASLPGSCAEGVPRLLINSERVGTLGSRADDVLLLGDCDTGTRKLATALGWDEELEELWRGTSHMLQEERQAGLHVEVVGPEKSKDEKVEEEIVALTKEVDRSLKVSEQRTAQIRAQVNDCNLRAP